MTLQQILFILVAVVTLSSALMVVLVRNLIHSALWLIASLFGVAILFAFLNANFLSIAQVVIYIGAISILMIFTIMLTRKVAIDPGRQFNQNWVWAGAISIVTFGGITMSLMQWSEIKSLPATLPTDLDILRILGATLVSPRFYVLPFELASVLLLAALIGAIVVAWGRK